MAYFANGSEAEDYQDKYCFKCVHEKNCPILTLHFKWNYAACNGYKPDATAEERVKFEALNMLWPRSGVHNDDCAMFYEREA